MPLLTVDKVSYAYGREPVVRDVSLEVEPGEIISLLGPNGSGKTTLLKMMLGMYAPHGGRVLLDGRDTKGMSPRQLARRIAYVPQTHRVSFAYLVIDVVLMGRLPHKPFLFTYSRRDREMALDALDRLSIAHLAERPYTDISGGERQLTLLARALAQNTDIFVMDEPVSGLDYGNQIRLLKQINDLSVEGYTFIKTTHFPDHALWVSDRVIMLKDGNIMADANAASGINERNLYNLYHTWVNVVSLPGGGRICLPRALCQDQGRGRERNLPFPEMKIGVA
jgi:iron complex transport system ATP-binding protein